MAGTHIRFGDAENNEYSSSDSDDDYTQEEKKILQKHQRQESASDSENEVYGVGSGSEDPLSESDVAVSDIEDLGENDNLPNDRAWGKDKRKFYSTDYVDPDYGGFQGKDAAQAELEEEEARNLQKRLLEQLDDDDYNFGAFTEQKAEEKPKEEHIKADPSKFSKRTQREIFEKEAPEFFNLVEDMKLKLALARDYLCPVMNLSSESRAAQFIGMYYRLILNYCTNVNMYLLLKASKQCVKLHPITKRLYQYRLLLSEMGPVFDNKIKPQIERLLEQDAFDKTAPEPKKAKKNLNLLRKLAKRKSKNDDATDEEETDENPSSKRFKTSVEKLKNGTAKKVSFNMEDDVKDDSDTDEQDDTAKKVTFDMNEDENDDSETDDKNPAQNDNELEETDSIEKRRITYQMAKNKGLTPHRKKEQRNPRVKHRNKFRKAKIRRKGQVREVRQELTRYSGEISGIKAFVSKSIKIRN